MASRAKQRVREYGQFITRLPDGVHEQIRGLAAANRRSMNSEIIVAIEKHLSDHGEVLSKPIHSGPDLPQVALAERQPDKIIALKSVLKQLSAACGLPSNSLYEQQRRLVREEILKPRPGRGPGRGVEFNAETLSAVLVTFLAQQTPKVVVEIDIAIRSASIKSGMAVTE